ncbi:putative lipoprotein [Desulfosporosinus sp. OT]|nr:putative lipoprotein [Desulfosporosinus sp. OT]
MEVGGLYNILAAVIGISIVTTGCLISYLFQKKLFNKYRDTVRNEMDKARSEPPVLPNKKV